MLRQINVQTETKIPETTIAEASWPSPFETGLVYSPPARGTWTIMHLGMLVPEVHEIFVCADCCLRGVVLSAAEMNAMDRFSTISVTEPNVLEGNMDEIVIDGVSDILGRMDRLPRAVMVYSSCIHHFLGCDLPRCFDALSERYPDIAFTDAYMTPTMRKSGYTPDQKMRMQMYSYLKPLPLRRDSVSLIGNCFSVDESSDLKRLLSKGSCDVKEITECSTFDEYLTMAESSLVLTTQPVCVPAAKELEKRMGCRHLHVPLSYDAREIGAAMKALADSLGIGYDGDQKAFEKAEAALCELKELIGGMPVAIDYTFTPRPLSLARMLLGHGFDVTILYLDAFSGAEKDDYEWLKDKASGLLVRPTVHASMRRARSAETREVLALGQKAAYFENTRHFVNVVENGGMYGFDGIEKLAGLMEEAYRQTKEPEREIQSKGLGCESCI